jgi:beta-N-acetylhexosaminidase
LATVSFGRSEAGGQQNSEPIVRMIIRAMICGASGQTLTDQEIGFFKDHRPAGLILFARNCATADQVKGLVNSFLETVGHDALVLIDQEGGRVQRLVPPEWPQYPPGRVFGALYDRDHAAGLEAVWLAANLIGRDLNELGINMDCLPVLDLQSDEGHDVIGDRAYHEDPDIVTELGRRACDGLLAAGVLPVVKHIPGHGRAGADSHKDLPIVSTPRSELELSDFVPFQKLAHMPAAMTAHVVYSDLDEARPATVSPAIIREVIRGHIGFNGLLMSDDVSMNALEGTIAERTAALIDAGCDMALHCNGNMDEMEEVAANVPELADQALARFEKALAMRGKAGSPQRGDTMDRLRALIA